VLEEVGGLPDQVRVSLCLYGDSLDPSHITNVLGCPPTTAHRKGDLNRGGAPYRTGAWILTEEGEAPDSPDQLTRRLLMRVQGDEETWAELGAGLRIELRFGIFFQGWNRGFDLSHEVLAQISAMAPTVGFDLYADDSD
jgi:hypothetical protein